MLFLAVRSVGTWRESPPFFCVLVLLVTQHNLFFVCCGCSFLFFVWWWPRLYEDFVWFRSMVVVMTIKFCQFKEKMQIWFSTVPGVIRKNNLKKKRHNSHRCVCNWCEKYSTNWNSHRCSVCMQLMWKVFYKLEFKSVQFTADVNYAYVTSAAFV